MDLKKVHVYIPMAIPGSGKTVLRQAIIEYINLNHNGQSKILTISSDEISMELMDEYQKTHPNASKDEAFVNTRQVYFSIYKNAMINVCKEAKQTVEIVAQFFPDFISICLLPKIGKPLENNLFSLTYLVSCVQRAIKREYHETLVGSKEKIASVVLFFLSLFNNFKIDNQPVKKIFYIPFTNEDDVQEELLREQLIDLLKELRKQKFPEDIQRNCPQELAKFIEICEKNDLGFPDKNFQKQVLWEYIKEVEK